MDWSPSPSTRGGAEHGRHAPGGEYAAIAQDRRFRLLRRRFNRLALIVTASFLSWYFLYILLSAFARDLMALPVLGNVNVAMVLGVLQFASTFLLAWRYTHYARTALDPMAAQLREEIEQRRTERERLTVTEGRRFTEWAPSLAGPAAPAVPPAPQPPAVSAGEHGGPAALAPPPPLPRRPKRMGRDRRLREETPGWFTSDGANAWFTPAHSNADRTDRGEDAAADGARVNGSRPHGASAGGNW